jgi:hypothetical protein
MKILTFLMILIILSNSSSGEALEPIPPQTSACPSAELFSDITYEDLRTKLDKTLTEKNKSLIFLDFRGLQAQIDVLTNHLVSEDQLSAKEAQVILKKAVTHLEQLEGLLAKAKESARLIKEDHVVPLATLTSLKSEADACNLIPSPYTDIFKSLSKLNNELNEILMLSPQKILAQKEKAKSMLSRLDTDKEMSNVPNTAIAENFNFMQRLVQNITQTFDFDTRVLQVATH